MTISLSIWSPRPGFTRIYIKGLAGQRNAKIWAQQCATDSFGSDMDIRCEDSNQNSSERGNLINDTEAAIDQLAGRKVRAWQDLLALASGAAV